MSVADESEKLPDADFDPAEQQESEDDLDLNVAPRFEALLTATDWTVGTLINQIARGVIDLNPRFQRRDAWRIKKKSEFIESIVMNIPIPQIVLAEKERGKFIVIDGKQRLLTLKQFAGLDTESDGYNSFKIQGLKFRKDLNGCSMDGLRNSSELSDDFNAFENFTIRTVVIRNIPNEDFLYLVFYRLNTASVPLSPQELRQALHPGKFSEYIDEYSIESPRLRGILRRSSPDFRMRDAELVIRYFAFNRFFSKYTGNLKPLLDLTTEYYNKNWRAEEAEVRRQILALERAIDVTVGIFEQPNAFRKWDGEHFEPSLNRAVFDAMILLFSDAEIGRVALANRDAVVTAFKNLCSESSEFRNYIEGTTKSKVAITGRVELWAKALASIGVPEPLIEKRLKALALR